MWSSTWSYKSHRICIPYMQNANSMWQQILMCEGNINGILPKGPYLPCVSIAGRALLAGYHRYVDSLQWCHKEWDGISNHQPHDCLLNCLFKVHIKENITGLCEGNSLATGEFPMQRASNTKNVSIWWHHHVILLLTWNLLIVGLHCTQYKLTYQNNDYTGSAQCKHF